MKNSLREEQEQWNCGYSLLFRAYRFADDKSNVVLDEIKEQVTQMFQKFVIACERHGVKIKRK